jgi:hypothetical protein
MFLGKAVEIGFYADGIRPNGKSKQNQTEEIRMKKTSVIASRRFTRLFVILAGVTMLALTIAQGVAAELLAGIAANGRLVLFASDDPEDASVVQVRGLQPGEQILGLDVRPLTGQLYALGSSARIYTINFLTGQATAVSSIPFTNELTGTSFGFDFNPTVDRIRIVSNTGWNIRVNPITGAVAASDTSLAYAAGDSGAGLTPQVVAAAYINNDTNPATATVLYGIDVARDVLVIQNPPNAGLLNTVGPLGVGATSIAGFDVSGVDGIAYAALVPAGQPGNSARAGLYTIDLTTGAATLVGKIGGPKPLTSLATLGTLD